ncbi:Amino acid/peptide transporter [Sphingomonas antarctica]|uniref:peptide MFS transporter n=1 Tax=Sphingomonas antarctica TaxID=2040274 RepID=UPI0039E8EEC3
MTAERAWFGQPRGLTILFLTNTWETFSYYGMRALLVYYMTKQLLLGQEQASSIYGLYTAGAYFTPILGGIIADRYLGKKIAIVIGGSIMAAGHFMMAFQPFFYPALATIAIGNGLFLPSLPSQIDDLYQPGDPRVGWAYNVYYVGVNIGGFLAPLVCGTLGEVYGWHYGFGAAGVGMLVGLCIYLWGQRYLPPQVRHPRAERGKTPRLQIDRSTLLLLAGIFLAVTVFRSAYEQIGNTVPLWADSGVDKSAGSMAIPMTWFIALNPLLVMLMTPPLLVRWRRREAQGHPSRPARRMAIGAVIVASSFVLLAILSATATGPTPWPWLALFFAILTFGELHILPTGLGLFARLAPPGFGATTVAGWYLASFAGSLAGGQVGRLWSHLSHAPYFMALASLALVAAAMLRNLDGLERRVARYGELRAEKY